jgi:multiple sugar transport system substrate-binding protein
VKKLKKVAVSLAVAIVMLMMAACGQGDGSSSGTAQDTKAEGQTAESLDTIAEAVTLKVWVPTMDDEKYQHYIADPIKQKFPNVTLDRLETKATTGKPGMEELLARGDVPDMFYSTPSWFGKQKPMDVYSDLTPLIKKYNFDLQRFQTPVLDLVKAFSDPGKFEFMPLSQETLILMYNKSIFDKFGVPYPKDGMTWDEARELARKLSRTDNGKAYRGLDITSNYHVHSNQWSLPLLNKENVPQMTNDDWTRYLQEILSMYSIPGNKPTTKTFGSFNSFVKDKDVAMYIGHLANLDTVARLESGLLDWDLVTMPTFKDKPNIGSQEYTRFMAISPASRNKDAVFKVLAHLVSDDVQLAQNKDGVMTVLKDENIKKQYFKNLKALDGKNVNAVLLLHPAKSPPKNIYLDYVTTATVRAVKDYVFGKSDLNTALRKESEVAKQNIETFSITK